MENLNDYLGTKWNTFEGFYVTIVGILNENEAIVEFNDGERIKARLTNIKLGIIMKPTNRGIYFESPSARYEGMIIPTVSSGANIKITKYNNKRNVEVEFLDTGYKTTSSIQNIRKGGIFNPYLRNQFNGYFGDGPYTKSKHLKIYSAWMKMLERTTKVGQERNIKNYSYEGTTVCEEWYNYQNFAFWFDTYLSSLNPNFYTEYQLDKDIFQRGVINKIYSPQTCCIIPGIVNECFIYERLSSSTKIKEKDLPTGVHKVGASYQINLRTGTNNKKYFGSYKTPEEASLIYKKEKEKYIKELANYYYNLGAIRKEVYDVLMNWEV